MDKNLGTGRLQDTRMWYRSYLDILFVMQLSSTVLIQSLSNDLIQKLNCRKWMNW